MSTPDDVDTIGDPCPECVAGKHPNCTIEILDGETWRMCGCLADGHE